MNEEYEIIHVAGEGRAIKNNKTGKIYYSEFQIIEEKNKELDQYKNNWEELKKWVKENSWYYNTSDGCQWVDQFKILDKMKELEGE